MNTPLGHATRSTVAATLALAALSIATPAEARQLEARVWLDRGHEPLLHHGDRVRLYYRTNRDAYVAIFRLDTNGTTRLVYPRSPHDAHYVRGGRDYRLLFPNASSWFVRDDPGIGYYFAIASEAPFDFGTFAWSAASSGYGWDLGQVYRTVYHDPYVAMDDLVAALVPDWRFSPYALDFATYHVGRRYDYPRFLCYDCHGFRSFSTWNPYLVSCTNFRVVIYNDPFYYPAYRYRGRRVVYVRPPVYRQPRFIFKERAYGEAYEPIRTARPAVPVVSTTVPPPPAGRGADDRVRRAVPRTTTAAPRQGEPLRAPGTEPQRRAQPSVLPPARPSAGAQGDRAAPGGRTAVPSTGPRTSTGTPRATPGAGTRRPTRPTQILPGRGTPDDLGMRRRSGEAGPTVRPPDAGSRPSRAAPPSAATPRNTPPRATPPAANGPSRATPPSRTAPPRALPRTGSGPSRVSPPRSGPPRATPPRAQPRTGPSRVTPPRSGTSRVTPPRTSGSSARPPVRPRSGATGSSARPPARPRAGSAGSGPPARPPARPPRTGSGGGPF